MGAYRVNCWYPTHVGLTVGGLVPLLMDAPAIADMFKPDDRGSQFSRKIVAGSKSVAVVLAEDRASIRVENNDGETVRFPLVVDNSSTVRIHYDGKQIEAVEVECLAKSVPVRLPPAEPGASFCEPLKAA